MLPMLRRPDPPDAHLLSAYDCDVLDGLKRSHRQPEIFTIVLRMVSRLSVTDESGIRRFSTGC